MNDLRLKRMDLLLYFLHLNNGYPIDHDRICSSINVSERTFKRYIYRLKKEEKIRIYKENDGLIFRPTEKVSNRISEIEDGLDQYFITPQTSGFQKNVYLDTIMKQLKDAYEKLEFLDRFFLKDEGDIGEILDDIKAYRTDSIQQRYVNEFLNMDLNSGRRTLEDYLETKSLYSVSSEIVEEPDLDDIEKLILKAEILKRRGKINEAMCIYDGLLKNKRGLEPSEWLLCTAGSVQCIIYLNKETEALDILDKNIKALVEPLEVVFLKKVKADLVQDISDKEASELYRSCLGLFHEKEYPMIRASILNNLGVIYFRKDEFNIATDLWEEAYRIVKRIKLDWSVYMTSINLADAYSLQGNPKKGLRLLGKARTFLKDVEDREGISEVDFNMALIYIELGNEKKAKQYFEQAESYPLTYERKLVERKKVFEGRLKKKFQ